MNVMQSTPIDPKDFSNLTRKGVSGQTSNSMRSGSKEQMMDSVRAGLDTMLKTASPTFHPSKHGSRSGPVALSESKEGAPRPLIIHEGKDAGVRNCILESGDVVRHKTLKCLAEVTKVKDDGSFLAEMQGVGKIKVRVEELANYERMGR